MVQFFNLSDLFLQKQGCKD
ncbi:hypothetical protein Pint_03102 [Pistacia integerrima]|uniref:Uncharacterized protein n=1 Tax=Pistacia integerrima TaxID=434235 RepID=A0ACC0ZLJ9_9ROSI|nr:hypothetical protein Pint_03102 [Pistacia integerrima]